MVHDVSMFAGFGSTNALFKAFVSPFAATAGTVGNAYAASLIAPPAQPPAPPTEPPTVYLPPPKPVLLDTSWTETGHIILTWISVTSLAIGVGVVLGLTSSTCIGKRDAGNDSSSAATEPDYEPEDSLSLQSDDPEKHLKQTIIRNI